MSLVTLNLPDWTANLTIIIFVLAFGRVFIKKFTELLNNLLTSFEIDENIVKNFKREWCHYSGFGSPTFSGVWYYAGFVAQSSEKLRPLESEARTS